jgi:hypothetical protein
MKQLIKSFYACLAGVSLVACGSPQKEFKSPAGYNLNKAEKFFVSENLQEVSGLALYRGRPDTMFSVQDEQGKLYYFPVGKKASTHVKFGKQADYEDVAICNETVIILRSNGTLLSFPFAEAMKQETDSVKEWKDMIPKGEYEGMYADNADNKVYVLCKNCKADKPSESVSGYIFQLTGDSLATTSEFKIDVTQIEALSTDKKIDFRPSCLAKNPATNEWYVLSSINKMLVVLDNSWKVTQVFELTPSLFKQPEGMVFDNQNNLYISNEGDDLSSANVLKFVYGAK